MDSYKSWADVPDNLKTKKQLGEMGLKPAKDQKPAAIKAGWKRYGPYDLYEIAEAVPKRKLTEAQAAVLESARRKSMTTLCCNKYVGYINWRERGDMCASCWYDELERRHLEMLKSDRREASEWANGVLNDKRAVILDTETTGLEGEIIEIAIIDITGKVLLNTLINPTVYPGQDPIIPPDASAIHGITDEMIKTAPSFQEVYLEIKKIFKSANRVIIYNEEFDRCRLRSDCEENNLPRLEYESECAMLWYAQWYGDWNDYYKSYRWQKLYGGGHRALDDCLACLERIKYMASKPDYDD